MIIHGKNVDFIIEEDLKLPSLRSLFLYWGKNYVRVNWLLIIPSKNILKLIMGMISSYAKGDVVGFFKGWRGIYELWITLVLEEHPEFISSDTFKIHIRYISDESTGMIIIYDSILSGLNDVYFKINLSQNALKYLLTVGEAYIKSIISHELFHHFDIKKLVNFTAIINRVYKIADKENAAISKNSFFIFYYFISLRHEGLAGFIYYMKMGKVVPFEVNFITRLVNELEDICNNFEETFEKKLSEAEETQYTHDLGPMMVAIIILHELFRQNKRFSAWIVFSKSVLGFKFEYRKQCNADRIAEFYGKKNFSLIFKDQDVDNLIYSILRSLTRLSHLQFLKIYEEACKYLGIENPIFTLKSYDYYKIKCWQNFQKLKRSKGFKK